MPTPDHECRPALSICVTKDTTTVNVSSVIFIMCRSACVKLWVEPGNEAMRLCSLAIFTMKYI